MNGFLAWFVLNFPHTLQVGPGKIKWPFLICPSLNAVKPADTFHLLFYSAAAKNFWQATSVLRISFKLSKPSDRIKNPYYMSDFGALAVLKQSKVANLRHVSQ